MIKILANDGINSDGKLLLEEANYTVETQRIPQEELPEKLPNFDAIIVRSATVIRKELIDLCPNLKLIARAGVGMDNIDVEYARSKGIKVINTPKASSRSVAELVIGQLFTLARFLHISNQEMKKEGHNNFKKLKKKYSQGSQLYDKTLGIIGFGRIGNEVARIALGLGMRILPADLRNRKVLIGLSTPEAPNAEFMIRMNTVSLDKVLKESDFITCHIPYSNGPLLGKEEFEKMKDGVFLINTARGGVICEESLLKALNSGKVAGAALDVFENEPTPNTELLAHPNISLTPHIGASTLEAQRNIGLELADAFIDHFGTEE